MLFAITSFGTQVGKSTAANLLHEIFNQGGRTVKRLAFADGLKAMLTTFLQGFGINHDRIEAYLYGNLKEVVIPEIGCSSRHLMKTLGTGWGREMVGSGLWANQTRLAAARRLNQGSIVIIDDLRHANELKAIKDLRGITIRVRRPSSEAMTSHGSDVDLVGVEMDYSVLNEGTLDELKVQLAQIVEEEVARYHKVRSGS